MQCFRWSTKKWSEIYKKKPWNSKCQINKKTTRITYSQVYWTKIKNVGFFWKWRVISTLWLNPESSQRPKMCRQLDWTGYKLDVGFYFCWSKFGDKIKWTHRIYGVTFKGTPKISHKNPDVFQFFFEWKRRFSSYSLWGVLEGFD